MVDPVGLNLKGVTVCSSDAAAQSEISKTLASREQTHGDFAKVAETAVKLKIVMQETGAFLPAVQLEALAMICTKIARILHGNPNLAEHWHDIAGYATLAERACDVVD